MRRAIRPQLERLEGKALLSVASASASGLADSLSATVARTSTGVQVVATLTETNATNHDLTVSHGPTTDGFVATQAGKTVWTSNGGLNAEYLRVDILKPGQSLAIDATWDGHSSRAGAIDSSAEGLAVSGPVTLSNELDRGKAVATVVLPKAAPAGVKLPHLATPKPAAHRS